MSAENQTPKNSPKVLVLAVLLICSLALNGFLLLRNSNQTTQLLVMTQQVDTLAERKADLEKEVDNALADLEQYKGRSEALDSLLAEATQKIEEQKRQIAGLIATNQDYQVLKLRYAQLQKTKNEYLERLAALEEENKKLRYENTELSVALDQTRESNQNLRSKVELAAQLRIQSIQVQAVELKAKNKEKPTDKAKKTDRLSISFVVAENSVATKGSHLAYIRLINPDGYVLADAGIGVEKFKTTQGQELPFSKKVEFVFTGDNLERQIVWQQDVFPAGTYTIEIYVDGQWAGQQKIALF
jgi:5-formyltetrahydrofolate cyclo-ligase